MQKRKKKGRSKGRRSRPSDVRSEKKARQEQAEEIFHPLRIKRGTTNEARTQLEVLAEMLRRVVERLQAMRDPDQRTIALANLGWRSAIEADRVATALGGSVDKIAWPTRNLYELNLRIRYLLADPENVTRFGEEMVSDQIKLLEALHSLFDEKDVEERKAIQGRIDFRRQQLANEGMTEVSQSVKGKAPPPATQPQPTNNL